MGSLGLRKVVRRHRPIRKFVRLDQPIELGVVDEVVVHSLDLARPHRPRRGADRHGDVRVGLKQHSADGRLTCAGRRRQDDKKATAAAAGVGTGRFGHGRTCLGPSHSVKRRQIRFIVQCTKSLETFAALLYVALQQRNSNVLRNKDRERLRRSSRPPRRLQRRLQRRSSR